MAVFFGEYLTYHHTGQTYATTTPSKSATPGNVINDQTVANQKAQAPK
jgi:hypothetical protein